MAQKYSCHLCVIRATGSQKLGRLNRKVSEVLQNVEQGTSSPLLSIGSTKEIVSYE